MAKFFFFCNLMKWLVLEQHHRFRPVFKPTNFLGSNQYFSFYRYYYFQYNEKSKDGFLAKKNEQKKNIEK